MSASFNHFILPTIIALLLSSPAKAQSFAWAQAINGCNTSASGTGVGAGATDDKGNLFTTGNFCGTVDFDAGPGVTNLTAVSNLDMFIMKEDPSGNLIWVKQVKGVSSGVYGCGGRGEVDDKGNIFIIGTFRDSFDFDPGPAVYKLNSYGGYHTFILKLDSAGNFVWVRDIGTQLPTVGASTTIANRDKNGYLYFAAVVYGNGSTPIDVDPGPGVYNITPGTSGLLLEKLDSNGKFIWAKVIRTDSTGLNGVSSWSLAFDSASNVFISGRFLGTADFDPGPGVYTLTCVPGVPNSGATDIFVAKYDSAGNFGWAHSFGNTLEDAAWGGAVDRFGNVLVTGGFGGTVDFDPGPSVYNLTSASTRSIFTLKLRNNGDFAWAKMAGSSAGLYEARAITTDDSGNVYTTAIAPGGCIVQKLDSSGNFVWGAGWEAQAPGWIGLDYKDSVYVTGVFSGFNKDFDPGPDTFLLSTSGSFSGFILKLNQTPLPTGIEHASLQTAAVSVYPNPSSGIVKFSSPATIHRIELTDLTGKVVYRAEPGSGQTVIDLGGKAAGVYFYEVDCGAGKQRGKLVVY